MKIKKYCFGGFIGFYARKFFPNLSSNLYLNIQRKSSNKIIKKYINSKSLDKFYPLFISIETVNRCNGTCPFCPCNIHDEKRPYMEMSDKVFKKIIDDLEKIKYNNTLMLLANNEILLDKKIFDRMRYARKKLPLCHMKMFTNGKLLTIKKFQYILDNNLVDEIIINNYSSSLKLNPEIQKVYDEFKNKNINISTVINMRYKDEVLSNRANSAPNKKTSEVINDYCALPFTDININPEGNLLICCCDALEKTNLGNVMDDDILSLFNNKKYINLRGKMLLGRSNNEFCKTCDFNDVGTRKDLMNKSLKDSCEE